MTQRMIGDDGDVRDETPDELRGRTEKNERISAQVPASTKRMLQRQAMTEERTEQVVIRRAVEWYLGLRDGRPEHHAP